MNKMISTSNIDNNEINSIIRIYFSNIKIQFANIKTHFV